MDVDAAALARAGFDLVHAFDARAIAATEPGLGVLGGAGGARGWLIGHTRALWAPFVAAVAADPTLAADDDPLDRYTERHVARAVGDGAVIFYAHVAYAEGFLPFQRLAAAAGVGTRSPTQLVIHPIYGPWIGLRAVVIADAHDAHVPPPSPRACACICADACHAAFARATAATGADAWRAWLAVRDACSIGRAYRYSDDQLGYHYTKDRRFLR